MVFSPDVYNVEGRRKKEEGRRKKEKCLYS